MKFVFLSSLCDPIRPTDLLAYRNLLEIPRIRTPIIYNVLHISSPWVFVASLDLLALRPSILVDIDIHSELSTVSVFCYFTYNYTNMCMCLHIGQLFVFLHFRTHFHVSVTPCLYSGLANTLSLLRQCGTCSVFRSDHIQASGITSLPHVAGKWEQISEAETYTRVQTCHIKPHPGYDSQSQSPPASTRVHITDFICIYIHVLSRSFQTEATYNNVDISRKPYTSYDCST